MQFLSFFFFLCLISCTRNHIDEDDEDVSIQQNHLDVEEIATPFKVLNTDGQSDAEPVDINSLPLLDLKSVTLKDFWFEVGKWCLVPSYNSFLYVGSHADFNGNLCFGLYIRKIKE